MAESLVSLGLCSQPCELDEYQNSTRELGLFAQLGGDKRSIAMGVVAALHEEILNEAISGAATIPCEGKMAKGFNVEGWPSENRIHCPVVARAMGNLNVAQFYSE